MSDPSPSRALNVIVVGAGAMGLLYSGRLWLTRSPNQVALVTRRAHAVATLRQGWDIAEPDGRLREVDCPVEDIDHLPQGAADFAILTTSVYSLAEVGERTLAALGPGGLLITLQNGISAGEELARVVPPDRVVQGATTFIASAAAGCGNSSRARTLLASEGETYLPATAGRLPDLCRWLDQAGLRVHASAAVESVVWTKAIMATSGLLCLALDADFGLAAQSPEFRSLALQLSEEIAGVAAGAGVSIDWALVRERLIALWDGLPRDAQTSLTTQHRAGRRTELEDRFEPIIRLATKTGRPVPGLHAVYSAAKTRIAIDRLRRVIDDRPC